MKKQPELIFTFHNPNKINDKYLDAVLNIFIEANTGKVKKALQAAAAAEEKAQQNTAPHRESSP